MLLLPIRQRHQSGSVQHEEALTQSLGRHVLLEALKGLSPSAAGGNQKPGNGEESIQLSVKNTFLEFGERLEDAVDLHSLGVKTTMARLSKSTDVFAEELESSADESEADESPSTCGKICEARAPGREASILPGAGRQVLMEALGLGTSKSPRAHQKVIIKNTFIDVADDSTPLGDERSSRTCTARFTNSAAAAFLLSSDVADDLPSDKSPQVSDNESSSEPFGPSVSAGSSEHGKLFDGQPACQPCAWFYKESGCLNGSSCRYCHLCPAGELKNRKRQKLARLRSQDAVASPESAQESPSALEAAPEEC